MFTFKLVEHNPVLIYSAFPRWWLQPRLATGYLISLCCCWEPIYYTMQEKIQNCYGGKMVAPVSIACMLAFSSKACCAAVQPHRAASMAVDSFYCLWLLWLSRPIRVFDSVDIQLQPADLSVGWRAWMYTPLTRRDNPCLSENKPHPSIQNNKVPPCLLL